MSLSDAWQKGAQQWGAGKREDFANDPLNLLATAQEVNSAKGDGDTASWLPPRRSYRCTFVARQVSVKAKYNLAVTRAEQAAMTRVLNTCRRQKTISAATARDKKDPDPTVVDPQPEPEPEPEPVPEDPGVDDDGGSDPDFGTCAAANDAGLGPYRRGVDPEYEYYRDADSDGVVCET